jgi:hypothetical protein
MPTTALLLLLLALELKMLELKKKKKVYNITWMLSNDVCAATEWRYCFASLPKQKKKKKKKNV